MKMRYSSREAVQECLTVFMKHQPQIAEPDARKLIARMIAEEPLA